MVSLCLFFGESGYGYIYFLFQVPRTPQKQKPPRKEGFNYISIAKIFLL